MLHMNDTNLNFNATSTDVDGNSLGTLSASYGGGEALYLSVNLNRMDAANVAAMKDDFDSFLDRVVSAIARAQQQ